MTKVRLHSPITGHNVGDIIDMPDADAQLYTLLGYVSPADDTSANAPTAPDDDAPQTKAQWVAIAEGKGIDTTGMTKADVQAAVGDLTN